MAWRCDSNVLLRIAEARVQATASSGRWQCSIRLMAPSKSEKNGKVSCAVNDADYLNRRCLPDIGHDVRVEIPETIVPVEQFILVMPNARSPS